MVQASVGFQCPECTHQRPQRVISGRAAMRGAGSSDLMATKVIIAVNVAVYLLTTVTGHNANQASGPLFERGALYGPLVAQGDWYRLVTSGFLHSGLLHVGTNMFLLYLLGKELEPALGRVRFVVLYFTSLVGGSLGVMLFSFNDVTLGASGAVFGLMGALVVLQLRAKQNPWKSGIGGLIVLNLVISFTIPGISWAGHIGGLLAGAAAGAVIQPLRWPQQQALARTGAVITIGCLLAAAAVLVAQAAVPVYG